jgi:hypothetical protein
VPALIAVVVPVGTVALTNSPTLVKRCHVAAPGAEGAGDAPFSPADIASGGAYPPSAVALVGSHASVQEPTVVHCVPSRLTAPVTVAPLALMRRYTSCGEPCAGVAFWA